MTALDETVGTCDLCGKEADARYEVRQALTHCLTLTMSRSARQPAVCHHIGGHRPLVSHLQDCHTLHCTHNCHREQGDLYHADCLKKVSPCAGHPSRFVLVTCSHASTIWQLTNHSAAAMPAGHMQLFAEQPYSSPCPVVLGPCCSVHACAQTPPCWCSVCCTLQFIQSGSKGTAKQ
jgi:hypothetical protein